MSPISKAEAVKQINFAFRALYHNGVWIPSSEAQTIAMSGIKFLELYAELAWLSLHRGIQKYPLQPKFHYLNHTWVTLLNQGRSSKWGLNPLTWACQMQEDFIGRPARLSRRCNPRSVSHRVLQRSFAATGQCLRFLVAEGL